VVDRDRFRNWSWGIDWSMFAGCHMERDWVVNRGMMDWGMVDWRMVDRDWMDNWGRLVYWRCGSIFWGWVWGWMVRGRGMVGSRSVIRIDSSTFIGYFCNISIMMISCVLNMLSSSIRQSY